MSDRQRALPSGVVMYDGPSAFNPAVDVIVLLTGIKNRSKNRKTGPMIQGYILRKDEVPSEVLRNRNDQAICGDCKFSSRASKACYVDVMSQGVNSVWKAWKNGSYDLYGLHLSWLFQGERVRFGAYGDPACVPYAIWEPVLKILADSGGKWTSFTHAWKYCDQQFKEMCVASVDNLEELEEARDLGWRTYRTLLPGEELVKGEFRCPASIETGKTKTCFECGACDGLNGRSARRGSAVIDVHGSGGRVDRYVRLRTLVEEAVA